MKTKPFLTFKYQYSRAIYDIDTFDLSLFAYNKRIILCRLEFENIIITGKALCHPDDKFDLETGINIAFEDAMKGYHIFYEDKIKKLQKEQMHIALGLQKKLWNIYDRNEKRFYKEIEEEK